MEAKLTLVETYEDAEAFMSWLGNSRRVLAFDTETGGLEWWRQPLRLVQFGDAEAGWAFDWNDWAGLIKDVFRRYDGPLVGHNTKFDTHFLEQNGINLRSELLNDTRVMAHLVDPAGRTGLKPLGARYIDSTLAFGESELKRVMTRNRWDWGDVPVQCPQFWQYSALDVVITAKLYEFFVAGGKYNSDLYDMEMAVEQILGRMESKGVRVDVEYCNQKRDEFLEWAERARKFCRDTYGFEVGSNRDVAARLISDGVVLTERTDSGANWKVDAEVLEHIDHPLAQLVLDVRKREKYANAFFNNWAQIASGDILHPDVNPLGARTGRMSISRPALQQVPRTKTLRNAFLPREGNVLISCDYDQVEARLLTHFSHDAGLLRAFEEDGDFFTNLGKRIYSDPSFQKSDLRRTLVKNGVYGKMYGSGPEKFSKTAHVSVGEARGFLSTFDAMFPLVREFQNQIQNRIQSTGIVHTPLGRPEPCEAAVAYKAVNYLIQGCAADIFKQTLVDLDNEGLAEPYLVLPVHDEVVLDVPAGDAEDVARLVEKVMQRNEWVPAVTSSAEILAERWGDKYE